MIFIYVQVLSATFLTGAAFYRPQAQLSRDLGVLAAIMAFSLIVMLAVNIKPCFGLS